ncbi:Hpt domain-containing protein [Christiangramia forsetii]|uniref:Two-component system response regulator containing Hpt phosphotransfer domain n=2 Tax=Christiangramia forsetii TaxID=411153 RepID=A0LZM6_CHRFK|nr:Hpt domain-containing protein [Christiangramia forsetii]GGG38661.1 hypothetical protein GCM10011532_23090 [Christiangramia forsetii]CAL65821.1 two-component system response regulator containing Hpt phosphotransfer domain [Christiangramia forsetii KT0803]
MSNLKKTAKISILLVGDSQDESLNFIDIVRKKYSDADIKVIENSFEALQYLQENKVHTLLIEENAQPMNAAQISDYLRQELKSDIPIFISSTEDSVEQNYISKPYTEESIQPILNFTPKEQVYEQPLYSLDYLKEISGGNSEFINDSIEIFKSSVKQQLAELEIASKENNDQKASEIAHNIKPSFEMLDNKEGTEICNKLTYDLKNHKLSLLVKELKLIFDKILQQLQQDFTPKNI